MNIGQMMRSMLGEASGTDIRSAELKPGQTVRALVLQVSDNNEAIVQINGVQVRAKLEVPLAAGQAAMLQVGAQAEGGLIMLKQIDAALAELPEQSIKDLLKQFALPDQKWAAQIIKNLNQEGIPLNKDAAQVFQQAAAAMPAGADTEQWMQAAASAFKRGLPVTAATISALQQVMFGPAAHELLDQLSQLASSAAAAGGKEAASGQAQAGGKEAQLAQQLGKLQALLGEGAELLRGLGGGEKPGAAAGEAGRANALQPRGAEAGAAAVRAAETAGSGQPAKASGAEAAVAASKGDAAGTGAAASTGAGAGAAGKAEGSPANWLGQMMKWLGVDHEQQLGKQLLGIQTQPAAGSSEQGAAEPETGAANQARSGAEQALRGDNSTGRNASSGQLQERSGAAERPQGAAQAQQQASAANDKLPEGSKLTTDLLKADSLANTLQGHKAEPLPALAQDNKQNIQESLKSVLLALSTSDDVPAALKETAQQLVQHITGQQLLMSPERNGALFSHLTVFVPFKGDDGNQTASVHIQTRRGRKGELDADNCRLLFDLSMKTLGDTVVDVHVVDKIVSLTLWNNHPAMDGLAQSSRAEVAESLNQAGYQLLSLRTSPIVENEENAAEGAAEGHITAPRTFLSGRYKGVDLKA
ncbi:hypothetical protein SAMN04487969_101393 [Paenibacillus algorifonticola]|uniref:Hook-length control protein FliK n=1 Tax=Paenibacillus algorifonticola TaxID=684063 RepID=A0A1I1Y979_9BACL|nr:hypothetical protein [Paenibacillus algorifonticola]SFE16126.1 hypothetical protein SAMN04487969_101393 [Paenibacillus algorifonticola]